jgi:putative glycosyltransferase (TIGR04372 family)
LIMALARSRIGIWLMLTLLTTLPSELRPFCIKGAQKLRSGEKSWAGVIDAAQERWKKQETTANLEVLVLALIGGQKYPDILRALDEADPSMLDSSATLRNAMTVASVEVGDFGRVTKAARLAYTRNPEAAQLGADLMFAAYASGQLRDFSSALEFFAAHYGLVDPVFASHTAERNKAIWNQIARVFSENLPEVLASATKERKTGVFFLNSTQALGHAILDPYHFLALNAGRYERVVFVGPPRSYYSAPTAACLRIVEQYGEYIETTNDLLQNLSWMSLGTHKIGSVELVVANYWSLLREATIKALEPDAAFTHNAWHMALPKEFESLGSEFAISSGIDLQRPMVVLHARDVGYHNILKQSYRDVDIADYKPAIHYLLAKGYQVIRLGDSSMRRLDIQNPDYHELPFMPGYTPHLDSFFIYHAGFMIGCQSGPCAYARVLGKPLLSINAVYHYTLLPSAREMGAFKHYIAQDAGRPLRELGISEILDRNLFWCENLYHFEQRAIELHCLSADEILDAIRAMLDWVEHPDLPSTAAQSRCIDLVLKADQRIRNSSEFPIADFLGIALPGYRFVPQQADSLIESPIPRKLSA